jgi:hypothetical protein
MDECLSGLMKRNPKFSTMLYKANNNRKKSHLQGIFILPRPLFHHALVHHHGWMDGWMISGQKNNFLLSHNSLANHPMDGWFARPSNFSLRISRTKD